MAQQQGTAVGEPDEPVENYSIVLVVPDRCCGFNLRRWCWESQGREVLHFSRNCCGTPRVLWAPNTRAVEK